MDGYFSDLDQQQIGKSGYFSERSSHIMDPPHQVNYYGERGSVEGGSNHSKRVFMDRTQEVVTKRRNYYQEVATDPNSFYQPQNLTDEQNYYYEDNQVETADSKQIYGPEVVQNVQNYYQEEVPRIPPVSSNPLPERPPQTVRSNLRTMASILKELKESILKSNEKDKKIILKLQNDHLKNKMLSNQLDEIRKENKQLKNFVYQKYEQNKTTNPVDQSHSNEVLPTKYGEMLSYYEGLLNVLQTKVNEIDQYYFDNGELRDHIKGICGRLVEYQRTISKFFERNVISRQKHVKKINQLKRERDSLRLAYDKMVDLLNKQNLERALEEELQKTIETPENDQKETENAYLRQEVEYLRAKMKEYEALRKWDAENQIWAANGPNH